MNSQKEYIKQQLRYELARREFWYYCKLTSPDFYIESRLYLKDMCNTIQTFINGGSKILVINMPPRHGKSRTGSNLAKWYLGRFPNRKVMTGSYNETLSTTFAKQVRDSIQETKTGDRLVYNDIFPNTKIKYGESAASLWALDGSNEKSYLATSPSGTATGFGCNLMIIDDLIKNAEEANNDNVLDKHWDWFTNTMMQRTEQDFKIIIIMTRWHSKDLAGRILEEYKKYNPILITYKAIQEDGSMLCNDILNKEDYDLKIMNMSEDIASANYQQIPIDIKGKLYRDFVEYDELPEKIEKRGCYIDTADEGNDFLSGFAYAKSGRDIYILDIVYSQEPMEITEIKTVDMIIDNDIKEADIESNNGGKGFARNVERLLQERRNYCDIRWFHQAGNKIARIKSNASQVNKRILFPKNWKSRWNELYQDIYKFQANGKNKHDDAPDALTGIIETVDKVKTIKLRNVRLR